MRRYVGMAKFPSSEIGDVIGENVIVTLTRRIESFAPPADEY